MSNFCHPCSVDFDYILRFETIDQEETKFKALMQFDTCLQTEWRNPNRPGDLSEDSLTKLYFEQLSSEEIHGLYEIYEGDFKMFGYSFQCRNMSFPLSV